MAAGLGDYLLEKKLCFQNPIDDYIYSFSPTLAPLFFLESLMKTLSNMGEFLLLLYAMYFCFLELCSLLFLLLNGNLLAGVLGRQQSIGSDGRTD